MTNFTDSFYFYHCTGTEDPKERASLDIKAPDILRVKPAEKFILFSPLRTLFAVIKILETLSPRTLHDHHLKTALVGRAISQEIFKGPGASYLEQKVIKACFLHYLGFFLNMGGDMTNSDIETNNNLPGELLRMTWEGGQGGIAKIIRDGFITGSMFCKTIQDSSLAELSPVIYCCAYSWDELENMKMRGNKNILFPALVEPDMVAASIVAVSSRVALYHTMLGNSLDLKHQVLDDIKECQKKNIVMPLVADSAIKMLSRRRDIWLDLDYPERWETDILLEVDFVRHYSMSDVYNFFFVLTDIIESRSPFTKDHTIGVTCAAQALAASAGVSEIEIQKLKLASIMHDVGKIAVPSKILHKQGKLSPEEWKKIQEHVYLPYLIMKGVLPAELQSILTTAALHHERLDGSGYPWGLKHESIPLEARILQIADVFSALLEQRPYKAPLSFDDTTCIIRQEIEEGKLWAGIKMPDLENAFDSLQTVFPHLRVYPY